MESIVVWIYIGVDLGAIRSLHSIIIFALLSSPTSIEYVNLIMFLYK